MLLIFSRFSSNKCALMRLKYTNVLQHVHCLVILMLLHIGFVYFALDLHIAFIYTILVVSMLSLLVIDT